MYNMGDAVGHIRLEMDRFLSDCQLAQRSTQSIDSQFERLGNTCKKIEGIIVKSFAAIGTAIVAGLGKATDVGSQFEKSMSQVAATMGMTSDDVRNGSADFERLSAAAKEMGETTKFSASQAADALNYLALAGYDTEQSISTLPTVLNLAAAGGMELAKASDMITDAASALGLSIDDLSLFSDKLAKASQSSNTSVQQLGDAILQIGGTARNLSGGVTELNTALGILANNGIKAAEGGTALRQIVLNLTAPTKQAKEYMEQLGLKVKDLQGNVRPLNEIFADLDEILQSKGITGSADKIEALSQIFDARQLKSATALLNNYGDSWDRLYDKIDNAEGAAAQMAETMETNLQGAMTILGSTAEGLGITIYESISDSLKEAVAEATRQVSNLNKEFKTEELKESLKTISDAFSEFIKKISEFIANTLPDLVKGMANLIDNFDKISSIIAGVGTAFVGATAGMMLYKIQTDLVTQSLIAQKLAQLAANAALLANPYTLVAISLGILVGALVNEYNQQQKNYELIDKANEKYRETANTIKEYSDAYDEEIEKIEELSSAHNEEIDNVNKLTNVIKNNVDETGKIVSNTELVKDAIDELNTILPINIQYQDDQIINYKDLVVGSKEYCEQLKQEAIVQANIEKYKAAALAYDDAEKRQEELTKNFEEAQKRFEEVRKAHEDYDADISKFQAEADAMGMFVGEYINDLYDSSKAALENAQSALDENANIMNRAQQDMLDAQSSMENANVKLAKASNELYRQQLEAGQKVTGLYKTEAEARIAIAEEEARKLKEINSQTNEELLEDKTGAEEDLEAALERLEIKFNTGIISSEEEYHKKRLELLENFHGEWTKKTSSWLKQERDYAQKQVDDEIEAEKRKYEEEERERKRQQREEEQATRERERMYEEETRKKIEEIDRRKKRDESYTDEQYIADLTALRDTIDKKNDMWQDLDDKIFDYQQKVTENNKKELEKQNQDTFDSLRKRKEKEKNYTSDMYIADLKAFADMLDKESDLYEKVMDEVSDEYERQAQEREKANEKSFQDLRDKYDIEKNKGYSLSDYLSDLNALLDTLDKTSDLYTDILKEISRVEDEITKAEEKAAQEEKKRIEDENKKYLESLKNRLKQDETYTKEMYLVDLQAFAETLDKESDLYQTILNEIADVNKSISDDNQKAADKAFKSWESGFDSLKSKAEKAYDEIIDKQKKLEDTLNGQIELYEAKTKKVKNLTTGLWEDVEVKKTSTQFLKDQMKEIESYQAQLEALEKKGISDDLMAEILGMDEESAKEYVKQLNTMSADSLKTYDETYQKLKQKNKEFSEKYYSDEVETFKTEWGKKITDYINTLPEEAKSAAKELIEEFVKELTGSDISDTNSAFTDIFGQMTSGLSKNIEEGNMFKNYGKKSIENLEKEIEEKSEDLDTACTETGENAGKALADGIESQEENVKNKTIKLFSSIKQVCKEEIKKLNDYFDKAINFKLPDSITVNNNSYKSNSANSAQLSANTKSAITINDLRNLLEEMIPNGDVVLNVDGDTFGRISRKQLNAYAHQAGDIGLQV